LVGWFVGLAMLLVATLALLLRWLLKPVRRLGANQSEAGTRNTLAMPGREFAA
jgi:hypothetical protein